MPDEFSFINKIKPAKLKQSSCIIGIGDDAAVYRANSNKDQVVCVDTMCEEVHFSRKTMTPFDIGWKAVAVNISDIAAMGGKPLYYLVAIAVPNSWKEEELLNVYEGMAAIADKYNIDLIGGDTVSTKGSLVIAVTVIGELPTGKALLRSSAMPGDIVFTTGTLGNSAAGLEILLHQEENTYKSFEKELIVFHQRPVPQVEAGLILSSLNERVSLNDISDGLASECNEIAEASNVSIEIDEHALPISNALKNYSLDDQLNWVYYGGEEYQLVGTTSKQHYLQIEEKMKQANIQVTKIGTVKEKGEFPVMIRKDGRSLELKKLGYNHFREGEK
ncbi:thiamine-phosphate kinase [Lottiidibacillus patelloidae]|uniref:thiamine-phosphate kinase n=1 Tax=Lottiidibacillus patelloidae TaxID=2670334 RepID=UPI002FCE6543